MKTRKQAFPMTARRSAIAIAVASALGGPAFAQDTELEEVVVTATRREADLQSIPLSVTAISSEAITELQLVNVRDLDKTVPGLKVRYSGADPTIIMRGAGAAGTNDIAVPVYVDGLYRPRAGQGLAGYLDVDRIEVLRGPQGTLFGRNTFGGLVNIISKQPRMEKFDFGVGATYGDYDLMKFEGFVNVPLGDVFALRVAASDTKRDPIIENVFNPDGGMRDEDNTYVRALLRFEPADNFDVTLGYTYWRDTSNGNGDYAGVILGIPVNPVSGLTDGVDGIMQLRQGRLPGTETQSWPATGGRNQAGTYPSDPASVPEGSPRNKSGRPCSTRGIGRERRSGSSRNR
jgi:iron complex outermembrane receptor protein